MNVKAIIAILSIVVATGVTMLGWGISADCRSQERDKLLWQRDDEIKAMVWKFDKDVREKVSNIDKTVTRIEAKL